MTFRPFSSLNFTHILSISPQSELPTVPMASAPASSPMFCGLRIASVIRFCKSSFIWGMECWSVGALDYWNASPYSPFNSFNLFTHLTLSNPVPPDFRVHLLRPRINAAAQTTDVLQAVAQEIGGRIRRLLALVVNKHNRPGIGAFCQNFLHGLL